MGKYIYICHGKLHEAEIMCMQALQEYGTSLGAEHTSTLDTVNGPGNLYSVQGKLEEVEKMYSRALRC